MLARITNITGASHAVELQSAAVAARAVPQQTLKAMAERTAAFYDAAAKSPLPSGRTHVLFPAVRVRDALGYQPWYPPPVDETLLPAADGGDVAPAAVALSPSSGSGGPVAWIAKKALGWRRTWLGELLYSMTPRFLLEALKARLVQ